MQRNPSPFLPPGRWVSQGLNRSYGLRAAAMGFAALNPSHDLLPAEFYLHACYRIDPIRRPFFGEVVGLRILLGSRAVGGNNAGIANLCDPFFCPLQPHAEVPIFSIVE